MNELTPFSTTDTWLDFINLWHMAVPCALCMVVALGSIIAGMISEQWHKNPRYLHEHDPKWIKENVK